MPVCIDALKFQCKLQEKKKKKSFFHFGGNSFGRPKSLADSTMMYFDSVSINFLHKARISKI